MNYKQFGLFNIFVFSASPLLSMDCNNPILSNGCNYYRECLEQEYQCGNEGYPLGYGEKYCNLFLGLNSQNNPSLSQRGVLWRNSTLTCLQSELALGIRQNTFNTCQQLNTYAFNSHPRCYTQVGASICNLPLRDWNIIRSVINFSDLSSKDGSKQIARVLTFCVGELIAELGHNSFRPQISNKNLNLLDANDKEFEIVEKLKFIDQINQFEK